MPTHGRTWIGTAAALAAVLFFLAGFVSHPAAAQDAAADAAARGEYIFHLAGCTSCHTDEKNKKPLLSGGVPLKTPFGTFYGPNITPDPTYGIGRWSEADFISALREGRGPDGAHLFPVFPFTSFTKMTDADAKDLWAYLKTVPAVAAPNKPHDVGFPFNVRLGQMVWKWIFFTPGRFQPDPAKSVEVNRGAYIVQALGHCTECHTQRNLLGGLDTSKAFAGNTRGPDNDAVPNLTPDPDTGLGKWSEGDLADLLKDGMTPDGDFVGGSMAEVVRNTTGKLSEPDTRAVTAFLKSLPPVHNKVEEKKPQ